MRTCACVLETYVRTDSTIYIYTARLLIEHPESGSLRSPIKKRAGVIPYIFSSSIARLFVFVFCSFYLLDLRTISSVNILEMT